ncbi:heme o synthase [Pseudomaricurvus sp. HS19]|uniref:heme o synthase n=1 Tax=Pseudomaricurvus sp. HS19 TaxID=2692626 RepID=UPI001371D99A|nr:heme o synthase [Pseudomaricurvus sp. HS19]MYM63599.1 protoheme IX farnesyltransferase [Pseudomaricurvus sp. HS19]
MKTTKPALRADFSGGLELPPLRTTLTAYYRLTKPRVVAVMLLTAVVGMLLASEQAIPWNALLWGTIGIGMAAGAAAAVNHVVDNRIDRHMIRTRARPLPQGELSPAHALAFAFVLGSAGLALLAIAVNPLTAWLTFASVIGYAVIYSAFLKRATPQNITIGGLAGAAPPLLGWTAVTNQVSPESLLLVLIIFAWTPPHFWALAIHKRDEYANAGVPMLPVTHGNAFTRLQIVLYTLLLVLTTLLPFLYGSSGLIYLAGVTLLNMEQLRRVALLFGDNRQAPLALFRYSITYVMLLFVILLLDHYL